jgi:hypothetical protein
VKTVSKEDLTRRWREVLESAQREGVILEEGGVRYRLRAEKLDSAGGEPPKTPVKSLYGSGRVGHQAMLAGLEEGRRAWAERDEALKSIRKTVAEE